LTSTFAVAYNAPCFYDNVVGIAGSESDESIEEETVNMTIKERRVNDVVILDVEGKILLGEGDVQLREAIQRLLQSGVKKILLNLADVPYIDSAGLGEIVRCYTTTRREGGELKLLNLTSRIRDLLTITKLITGFGCFDTEESAL